MSSGAQTNIEFDDVRYEIGGRSVLAGLTFSVQRGEVLALLGESGCGKTTTLKLVNRLIDPTAGSITVDGRNAYDWDPIQLRRHIGYVLQDGGLFPHFTVRQNVAVTLRLLGRDPAARDARSDEMLGMVGLEPERFAHRFPHELSGGQRQRVGVARALAADPEVVLLDEPFGALDVLTRASLQQEFARLVTELGKTAVFVTHDLHEAQVIADRIALMERGTIVFLGTPAEFAGSDHPLARAYLAAAASPA